MSARRLFGRHYCLVFRIVSVETPSRRRWRFATHDGDGNFTCYGASPYGEVYILTAKTDGTLELDVIPEMDEHVAVVDWIRWDKEGCTFQRCPGNSGTS